jgi:hypothetical protein
MSHRRLVRLLLICAVAFSAVASSQTAFAAEPQIFTYLDTGSNFRDCGSFIMREDYSIPTRVIVFASDPDGNAIYGQAHQDYSGTFTNLTTGYSLLATKNQTIIFDDRVGTHRVLGLQFSLIIPGEGVAILDAGNFFGRMTLLSW